MHTYQIRLVKSNILIAYFMSASNTTHSNIGRLLCKHSHTHAVYSIVYLLYLLYFISFCLAVKRINVL